MEPMQPLSFTNPFNARAIEPSSAPQPLPAGDYKVIIFESAGEAVSTGKGGMLHLKLRVIEGQYMNRELHYYLNLFHESQTTVEIAQRQLSAICHVTGVFDLQNSQQLHNIPFIAVVEIQRDNSSYNQIKGVRYLDGSQPGKPGTAAVAATPPPAQPPAQQQGWNAPTAPQVGPPQPVYAPPTAAPTAPPPNYGAPPQANPGWQQPGQSSAPPAQQPQTWQQPPQAAPQAPPANGWQAPASGAPASPKAPWER
jgi:hypothetical protein